MLDNYIKWFLAHERILALFAILAVVGFAGNKYLNLEAARADARNQAAQQTLAAQKEVNAQLAQQNALAQQQYQTLVGQLNAQNQRLTAEMLTLSQTLATQQKKDSALPAPELALRHEALLGVSSGVTSTENGFQVSTPVEIQTVQSLESLPVLKQQLSDETQIASGKDKQITSINTVVTGLNDQINGLNLQLTDSGKACDAKLVDIKANARKSKRNWFIRGLGIGAAIGTYLVLHL